MKFTIDISDEQLAAACQREFTDSISNHHHNGHITTLIRTCIAQQVTPDVVRPIVEEAIKQGVRKFADSHLEEIISRMVRKIVSEKKADIAKELESPQMALDPK